MLPLGLAAAVLCALAVGQADARNAAEDVERLLSLSLEELGQLPVTSASLHSRALSDAAASVYVIRREDILASGARSLTEALRLAPNLHVARTDARGYAISARGLKTTLSNKLLVLLDGRPIYTPLFSGVLWDQQDTLIQDVERIEVISGPGAAAWGTNAVNGVINIITRPSEETVGTMLSGFAGDEGHGLAARHGWTMGEDGAMRAFVRRADFSGTEDVGGAPVGDGWTQSNAGLRSDWTVGADAFRVQAAAFHAEAQPRPSGAIEVNAHSLIGFWSRGLAGGGSLDARAFYDVVDREDPLVLLDRMTLLDIDVRHTRHAGVHSLVWGAGYRHGDDESTAGLSARLIPAERTLEWASLFVEDSIALSQDLDVALGLRAEKNSYTGVELLPSARFSWNMSATAMLWGSASRAVRAPARFDRELFIPASEPFFIRGGPDFESEVAEVAELGIRSQPWERLHVSATAFHHWFHGLRAGRVADAGGVEVSNGVAARVWGVEAWATTRVTGEWELSLGLLELRSSRRHLPGFSGADSLRDQGNDPEHQLMLRLTRALPYDQQLFVHARHVSALPDPFVPSYTALDARWSWRPSPSFELGVRVDNLLDEAHAEFAPRAGFAQSVFGRSVGVDMRLDW